MKIKFTQEEAGAYLDFMRIDHDIVRLVNPETRRVRGERALKDSCAVCHTFWGRCDRCENCTSLRALRGKSQAYKLEVLRQRTFLVFSRYLEIDGTPWVAEIVKDITDQIVMNSDQKDQIGRMIANYNYLLITDPLTEVYNRRFLDEHFLPSLKCCPNPNLTINLAFIDIDDFKQVNDRFGHSAGDRLLKDAAAFWKLHYNFREKGKERLVVRFGGDEFLVIACGIPRETFREEIEYYYGQMRKVCYCTDTAQIPFSLTFGIASTEEMGREWSWDALIEIADHRMYAEKARRKVTAEP